MEKIFISYANNDPEWPASTVEALANSLSESGVDVCLDVWYERALDRKPSDTDLISTTYSERARRLDQEDSRGRGIALEAVEIQQILKRDKQRNLGRIFLYIANEALPPPFLRGRCPEYSAPLEESDLLSAVCGDFLNSSFDALIARYRTLIIDECLDLYIPLTGKHHGFLPPTIKIPQSVKSRISGHRSVESFHLDITQVVDENTRALVLGEPGAGKTFALLKILARDLEAFDKNKIARLREWMNLDESLIGKGVTAKFTARHNKKGKYWNLEKELKGHPLPIFVKLRDWNLPDVSFDEFLQQQAPELSINVGQLYRERKARLILDGLNEIPQHLAQSKIAELMDWLSLKHGTYIITSRLNFDFLPGQAVVPQRITIEPLSATRIRLFVDKYLSETPAEQVTVDQVFWNLVGGDRLRALAIANKIADSGDEFDAFVAGKWISPVKLKSGFDQRAYLEICADPARQFDLATNPYTLAMLLWIYKEQRNQPKISRVDLFERYLGERVRAELEKTDSNLAARQMDELLTELAVDLQNAAARAGANGQEAASFSMPVCLETPLQRQIVNIGVGARVITYENGSVAFRHQLLQEYYVARHIFLQWRSGAVSFSAYASDVVHLERSAWEQTFILLAEYCPQEIGQILILLLRANPEIAAEVWEATRIKTPERLSEALQTQIRGLLMGIAYRPQNPSITSLSKRMAAGRALGMMRTISNGPFDDRPGTYGTHDKIREVVSIDIAWVPLLVRPSRSIFNLHGRNEIAISKYPITVGQFRIFFEHPNGWKNKRWWKYRSVPESPDSRSIAAPDNHPCTHVSWIEASAYCSWLSSILACNVRLPTFGEWEFAASGASKRRFPWGNEWHAENANAEGTVGETSPVGAFPAGATPSGIEDMAGNVLEWTSDQVVGWLPKPPIQYQIAKGGSWAGRRTICQDDFIVMYSIDGHFSDLGFRVVRADPIRAAAEIQTGSLFEEDGYGSVKTTSIRARRRQ